MSKRDPIEAAVQAFEDATFPDNLLPAWAETGAHEGGIRAAIVAYLRGEAARCNATEGGGWCARLAAELEAQP